MKKCVRIYIEGGAEGRTADRDFRRGWKLFLNELHELARQHGYHSLEIVRGRSRSEAFGHFTKYHINYPNDLCVLLADAETQVTQNQSVWQVVAQRTGDKWVKPNWANEDHLYLMVHFVETWLLSDIAALEKYFKRGFVATNLPKTQLEQRSKQEIENALKVATRNTGKGCYRHGQAHEIIEFVSPEKVKTLWHGNRLFENLAKLIVAVH